MEAQKLQEPVILQQPTVDEPSPQQRAEPRKPFAEPRLERHEDLTEITGFTF